MIVDANILLYAVDRSLPQHEVARTWLTQQLNGRSRVGLPWPSLLAFMRIATHPRASQSPLSGAAAWEIVTAWLDQDVVWIPTPTRHHAAVFGGLVRKYAVQSNLVPDTHLAALSIELGVPLASADYDFARFTEITWINPLPTPNT